MSRCMITHQRAPLSCDVTRQANTPWSMGKSDPLTLLPHAISALTSFFLTRPAHKRVRDHQRVRAWRRWPRAALFETVLILQSSLPMFESSTLKPAGLPLSREASCPLAIAKDSQGRWDRRSMMYGTLRHNQVHIDCWGQPGLT